MPPPDDLDDGLALEAGRHLFAQDCTFLGGARALSDVPASGLPEVAFAGRSNVGKSSLVNALTGRKTLARTSHTPGRTREINVFDLGHRLGLVDLPGFGFARASKAEAKDWSKAVRDFLRARSGLTRVCLLIDARRSIMTADETTMTLIDEAAMSFQVVLTKADKVTPSALEALMAEISAAVRPHPAAHPEVLATSSRTGLGLAALRARLAALAQPHGSSIRRPSAHERDG